MKKVPGKVTISRVEGGREYVSIELKDVQSGCAVTAELSIEAFGEAILGLNLVPCDLEIPDDTSKIGKIKETQPLKVEVKNMDKEAAVAAIVAACPEGWEPSLYLGSKSSFSSKDGKTYANTTMSRWVERDETTP